MQNANQHFANLMTILWHFFAFYFTLLQALASIKHHYFISDYVTLISTND